jgi:hypothetical protein
MNTSQHWGLRLVRTSRWPPWSPFVRRVSERIVANVWATWKDPCKNGRPTPLLQVMKALERAGRALPPDVRSTSCASLLAAYEPGRDASAAPRIRRRRLGKSKSPQSQLQSPIPATNPPAARQSGPRSASTNRSVARQPRHDEDVAFRRSESFAAGISSRRSLPQRTRTTRLAARGGWLHRPGDPRAGPRDADVTGRATASVMHRTAASRGETNGRTAPTQAVHRDRFHHSGVVVPAMPMPRQHSPRLATTDDRIGMDRGTAEALGCHHSPCGCRARKPAGPVPTVLQRGPVGGGLGGLPRPAAVSR